MSWLDSVEGTLQEAWTGNLSPYDKQAILDASDASIAKASAGAEPGIITIRQQQAQNSINSALNSFAGIGESGSESGAQPSTTGRVPGLGTLGLANLSNKLGVAESYLKWGLIIAGSAAVLFFGFPYIAPQVLENIRAARLLKSK
jgi:hypothetical protein